VAIDRLSGLITEEFDSVSRYVDIVEIGWGLPLVWKDEDLVSRIKYYKKQGVHVSMSGTLLEHSLFRNSLEAMLKKAGRNHRTFARSQGEACERP
jgi:phosphosulfolactate synthase (CoM biosynthesis protein A)